VGLWKALDTEGEEPVRERNCRNTWEWAVVRTGEIKSGSRFLTRGWAREVPGCFVRYNSKYYEYHLQNLDTAILSK